MQHYYSEKQQSPLRITKIKDVLLGREFEFYTANAVFSPKRIDKGSRLLIENAVIKKDALVLDLGCGYGPVGIAIALYHKPSMVVMSDVNRRALMLAKKNSDIHGAKNIKIVFSDGFKKLSDYCFDTVLLNPPQHAGKKLCNELIEDSLHYLKKKGTLQLVARHNKGGSQFEKKMKEVFGNCKALVKKSGYRVYSSVVSTLK